MIDMLNLKNFLDKAFPGMEIWIDEF